MKILIVEHDENVSRLLQDNLHHEGHDTTHVLDSRAGLNSLRRQKWDAIILNLTLPDLDGMLICLQVRTLGYYIPVIIISSQTSEMHRVLGLELGADDYLVKPFSMQELKARLRALLRLQKAMNLRAADVAEVLIFGCLSIHPVSREVKVKNNPIRLTKCEFDLLYFLAKHPDKVFTRLTLLNQVWGYDHDGYEHTVNTHINRLRTKTKLPHMINTVWGVGYKFTASLGD